LKLRGLTNSYSETLIDHERLSSAYEEEGFYSLQLEIGDLCMQGCIYCYMNALEKEKNTLSDELVDQILEEAHKINITAVEWLGGEPLLRSSVFDHMAHATELGLRNNVWTGGLPLADANTLKNTAKFAQKGLIAFHISTINPALYEGLHPSRSSDDLELILESIGKLLDLGYPPTQLLNSVTFTGLQTADDMIRTIEYFEEKFGIKTSLNVYHTYLRPGTPVGELKRFIPLEDEVKKVYEYYCRTWGAKQLPMNCVSKQYCATTVAVLCDGSVTPCATIREKNAPNIHSDGSFYDIVTELRDYFTFKPFRERKNLPEDCQHCRLSERCFGCRSRSYAAGLGMYGKDPRCFRGK